MVESILNIKSVGYASKIKIKTLISIMIIGMAVLFPQLIHSVMGPKGGMILLPMYMPVILAGCMLGSVWGIAIGILSPVISFVITSFGGDAMPAVERLPFMIVELSVFAGISGVFSKRIYNKPVYAIPAVMLSAIAGRTVYFLIALLCENSLHVSVETVLSQIQMGVFGVILQIIIVTIIVNVIVRVANLQKEI